MAGTQASIDYFGDRTALRAYVRHGSDTTMKCYSHNGTIFFTPDEKRKMNWWRFIREMANIFVWAYFLVNASIFALDAFIKYYPDKAAWIEKMIAWMVL